MTTNSLAEDILKTLEIIPFNTVKKRIARELQNLDENCSLISIEVDKNDKDKSGHVKPVINIYDNSNGLIYSLTLDVNYPFRPPNVKINYIPYYEFLRIKFLPFTENLKKIYKINCLCCSTITCSANWTPAYTTNHLIEEIRTYKSYKRNLLNKLFADKIKVKYLIDDIDLDCWFF
jgi:ubiquitin-protein ligase